MYDERDCIKQGHTREDHIDLGEVRVSMPVTPFDPIIANIEYHAVCDGPWQHELPEPPTVEAHIERAQPWEPGKGRHRRPAWWRRWLQGPLGF